MSTARPPARSGRHPRASGGLPASKRAIRPPRRKTAWGCLARAVLLAAAAPIACGIALTSAVIVVQGAGGPAWLHLESLADDYGMAWILPQRPLPVDEPLPSPGPLADGFSPSATAFQPGPSDTAQPPTATATPSPTFTPTATETDTPSITASETWTATPTETWTTALSATSGPIATATFYATLTPTRTRTRTPTRTPTRTRTVAPPTATAASDLTPSPVFETPTAEGTSLACDAVGNTSFESALLGLINRERQDRGLAPYHLQNQLRAAAVTHSTDMACNDFLSHTGSDGSSVRDRVEREGYSWSWIGENIFATGDTSSSAPQRAFDWWMNSTLHRANLLSPNYTEIGIGYMYRAASSYGGYFTAVFARP